MTETWIIDIETECAVTTCPRGSECHDKEKHALSPRTNRITDIGMLNHTTGEYLHLKSVAELNAFLATRDIVFVGHHAKFDFLNLIAHGANITADQLKDDTEIMAHVLTEKISTPWLTAYEAKRAELNTQLPPGKKHRKAGQHSLKTLAPYFCKVEPFWEKPGDYSNPEYLYKDVYYTHLLYKTLSAKLKEKNEWDFYKHRELEYAKMLIEAELVGVPVDEKELQRIKKEYTDKSHALKKQLDIEWAPAYKAYYDIQVNKLKQRYQKMYEARKAKTKDIDKLKARYEQLLKNAVEKLDRNINFNSDKQMLWLVQDYLGLEAINYQGKPSTNKEVLKGLARQGRKDLQLYLDWRECEKILTAYIPSYEKYIRGARLYPTFNITSTRTGRLSSERPNLQQVPKDLKPVFKAEEGSSFVGYDSGAIEAKIITYYTADPALYQILQQGWSIHDFNAKSYMGLDCDVEEVKAKYPKLRAAAKRVGFSLFYGAGVNRIEAAFKDEGIPLDRAQCADIKNKHEETYTQVKEFHRALTKIFEAGKVVPNLLGRPIKIQNPDDAYMKGFNTLVQSSASDLMLEAALLTKREYKKKGIPFKLHLFVHDFIQAEGPSEYAKRAEEILVNNMTKFKLNNGDMNIQLTVDGGISSVWK